MRRLHALVGGALMLGLGLLGCGGDDPAEGEPSTAAADVGASAPKIGDHANTSGGTPPVRAASSDGEGPEPEPASEGTLRVAFYLGLQGGFDPHGLSGGGDILWLGLVYDSLLQLDAEGALVPGIAESWSYSDSSTELTLQIRDGLTFQDGTTLGAAAVKANLDRARGDGMRTALALSSIDSVEAVDPSTVRIVLSEPDSTLLYALADRAGMLISPSAFDSELATTPAGAGRFTLVEHRPGDRGVFERWDGYWNPDDVAAQRIELIVLSDATARLNALRTGQVDVVTRLTTSQIDEAEGIDGITVETDPGLLVNMMILNRQQPALQDPRVRQALNFAIGREALTALDFGHAVPTTQAYQAGALGYSPVAAEMYPHDPNKARQLLADAGTDTLTIDILVPLPESQPMAEAIQSQLADVGVTMNIQIIEATQVASMLAQGSADGILGPTTISVDPVSFYRSYVQTSTVNPTGHAEPTWTDALATAKAATDPTDLEAAAAELASTLTESAANVFLTIPDRVIAYRDNVVGFHLTHAPQPDLRGVGLSGD